MSADVAGGLAALASALFFTIAAILFQGVSGSMSAAAINFIKGLVALLCMAGVIFGSGLTAVDGRSFILLGLSGLLGITVGDTAYFLALRRLGARRTLLVDTLSPGFTVLMATVILHDHPTPTRWLGILLTLGGVAWVMWERSACDVEDDAVTWRGWMFGLAAMACHAGGVILSKMGLETVAAPEGTIIRQIWASAALLLFGLQGGRLRTWLEPLRDKRVLGRLIAAALLGSFLGIWMSLLALSLTKASLATTLNATSPLFILVLARLVLKEHVSVRSVLGATVAVAGVVVLLLG